MGFHPEHWDDSSRVAEIPTILLQIESCTIISLLKCHYHVDKVQMGKYSCGGDEMYRLFSWHLYLGPRRIIVFWNYT
jgi:hypothetical protein